MRQVRINCIRDSIAHTGSVGFRIHREGAKTAKDFERSSWRTLRLCGEKFA